MPEVDSSHIFHEGREALSPWLAVTQELIDSFGRATLDTDRLHDDPAWARQHGPFGTTIAFGFQTVSLLSHLANRAFGIGPEGVTNPHGYSLNYGFDRLRLVSPVRCGSRIRGRFRSLGERRDERGRTVTTLDATVEIEGEERPALIAHWLVIWVPHELKVTA
jgi:acyl dehydratase